MNTKDILLQLRTQKGLSQEQLIEFCVEHMASDAWPKEQVRAHMEAVVPNLKHWKKCPGFFQYAKKSRPSGRLFYLG